MASSTSNFHLQAEAQRTNLRQAFPITDKYVYNFQRFFHSFVGELTAQLNQKWIADMLAPDLLIGLTRNYLRDYYTIIGKSSDATQLVEVQMPAGFQAALQRGKIDRRFELHGKRSDPATIATAGAECVPADLQSSV